MSCDVSQQPTEVACVKQASEVLVHEHTLSPRMAPPKMNTMYTLFLFISVCTQWKEHGSLCVFDCSPQQPFETT